ncbi:hypothetical protein TNCV_610321 [Trichonephila clavipes]|nr:hypothetical protein TNCV_610321 [Trichonephila clavipes]
MFAIATISSIQTIVNKYLQNNKGVNWNGFPVANSVVEACVANSVIEECVAGSIVEGFLRRQQRITILLQRQNSPDIGEQPYEESRKRTVNFPQSRDLWGFPGFYWFCPPR